MASSDASEHPVGPMTFALSTKMVIGRGAVSCLPEQLCALDMSKPLVVTDPGLARTQAFEAVTGSLREAGVSFATTADVEPQPTVGNVLRGYAGYRANGCDGAVALGGGSAIDTAKGIAILATNGGDPRDYHGSELYDTPPAPLVAIPTTAGTGSEVSYAASIRDEEKDKKLTIRHKEYNTARVAVLDPEFLHSLPRRVAVTAGMDALTHGVESYVSREATVLTQALSLRASELIGANLRDFVADRGNSGIGERMLVGSSLAGIAFSYAGTGNAHCLARTLAGSYHMEHGMSCAVTLPHVAAYNVSAAPTRYARVAAALGEPVEGLDDGEAAGRAVSALFRLAADLEVPPSLESFGVTSKDVGYIAKESMAVNYNRWNPRFMQEEDFGALVGGMV